MENKDNSNSANSDQKEDKKTIQSKLIKLKTVYSSKSINLFVFSILNLTKIS